MNEVDIKKNLELEYDIPFVVTKTMESGEPVFMMGPESAGKELFSIRVCFRNKVRLYMDFIPQKYSANFIESMAQQPVENRNRFIKYVQLLKNLGAKCTVSANGVSLNLNDYELWPKNWRDFRIRVTKMPIDENFTYTEIANTWGALMMGAVLSLANIVTVDSLEKYEGCTEGTLQRITVNRYERNPLNRKICLTVNGYNCVVCGMNFEEKYGIIGHHFIHVHHIVPVSQMRTDYVIDPVRDLVPVCPNCHYMMHKKNPPFMPKELRKLIEK